jgi:hypothetical protein
VNRKEKCTDTKRFIWPATSSCERNQWALGSNIKEEICWPADKIMAFYMQLVSRVQQVNACAYFTHILDKLGYPTKQSGHCHVRPRQTSDSCNMLQWTCGNCDQVWPHSIAIKFGAILTWIWTAQEIHSVMYDSALQIIKPPFLHIYWPPCVLLSNKLHSPVVSSHPPLQISVNDGLTDISVSSSDYPS